MMRTFLCCIFGLIIIINTVSVSSAEGVQSANSLLLGEYEANYLVEPKYQSIGNYNEGIFPVALNGKWGMIDLKGTEVLAPTYSSEFEFKEGLAAVEKSGKYGYINKLGKEMIKT